MTIEWPDQISGRLPTFRFNINEHIEALAYYILPHKKWLDQTVHAEDYYLCAFRMRETGLPVIGMPAIRFDNLVELKIGIEERFNTI